MPRVLVTGSADGLGRLAAQRLVERGHAVVLHARSAARAQEARAAVPGAAAALVGDLSSLEDVRALAEAARAAGPFDAVIHNAGVYHPPNRDPAALGTIFTVNVLAPYLLTALVPAGRLVYLSSGLHRSGDPALPGPRADLRRWAASRSYADSKLLVAALAFACARRWPAVASNAVDPGWVPTKMGGPGAPDDLEEGAATQVWLAAGEEPEARASGRYWFHRRARPAHPAASDPAFQDGLLRACEALTGVPMPAAPPR
jgi:NAD(P)-dependent dehydrogenase (short-subunit alcohol dehydrogenase family)